MKHIYKKDQWSNNALELAMEAIDQRYSYSQVSIEYGISKSNLKDHMIGKLGQEKWGLRKC